MLTNPSSRNPHSSEAKLLTHTPQYLCSHWFLPLFLTSHVDTCTLGSFLSPPPLSIVSYFLSSRPLPSTFKLEANPFLSKLPPRLICIFIRCLLLTCDIDTHAATMIAATVKTASHFSLREHSASVFSAFTHPFTTDCL